MEEPENDVKQAVRTALRSIKAAAVETSKEECCGHLAAAVEQLAFAVEKLTGQVETLQRESEIHRA